MSRDSQGQLHEARWRVAEWFPEIGEGVLEHPELGTQPFHGALVTGGPLAVGVRVFVEFSHANGVAHVAEVSPAEEVGEVRAPLSEPAFTEPCGTYIFEPSEDIREAVRRDPSLRVLVDRSLGEINHDLGLLMAYHLDVLRGTLQLTKPDDVSDVRWMRWRSAVVEVLKHQLSLSLTPLFRVQQLYRFDWASFEGDAFDTLSARYAALPGYLSLDDDIGRFFGKVDGTERLEAEFDSDGLRVHAVLTLKHWREWERTFLLITRDLPVREQ